MPLHHETVSAILSATGGTSVKEVLCLDLWEDSLASVANSITHTNRDVVFLVLSRGSFFVKELLSFYADAALCHVRTYSPAEVLDLSLEGKVVHVLGAVYGDGDEMREACALAAASGASEIRPLVLVKDFVRGSEWVCPSTQINHPGMHPLESVTSVTLSPSDTLVGCGLSLRGRFSHMRYMVRVSFQPPDPTPEEPMRAFKVSMGQPGCDLTVSVFEFLVLAKSQEAATDLAVERMVGSSLSVTGVTEVKGPAVLFLRNSQ